MRLVDWTGTSSIPACRWQSHAGEHRAVIVRTAVGAEHLFAVIDTGANTVQYVATSQLLDALGEDSAVEPVALEQPTAIQHGTLIQDWAQVEQLQDGQRVRAVVWDQTFDCTTPAFDTVEPVSIHRRKGTIECVTTDNALAYYRPYQWEGDGFYGDGHALKLYLLAEGEQDERGEDSSTRRDGPGGDGALRR